MYGRQVFDEFILRDVGTTILWHVYMMIGPALEKWVDILPEHYRCLQKDKSYFSV